MNQKSTYTIVCLGDSITSEQEEPHYPSFWQTLLDQKYGPGKFNVISAGVNGETARDGYHRLYPDVLSHSPDLVTIMFGHNDLAYGYSPQQIVEYLEKIIEDLRSAHVPNLWLLTPNLVWGVDNQANYPLYLKTLTILSQTAKIPLIDLWHHAFTHHSLNDIYDYFVDTPAPLTRDWVHPNEIGHRLIATYLMAQFEHLIS
jgi:lysophospholipase L1-like esterase